MKEDKITNDYFQVTCKNCKRVLDKDKKKWEEVSHTREETA